MKLRIRAPQPPIPTRRFLEGLQGCSYVDALLLIAQHYGPLVKLSHLGRHYLVSDPVLVHHILVSERGNYVKDRYLFGRLGKLLGRGLLTNLDDSWRTCRRQLQPAFQRERLFCYEQQNKKILDNYLQRFEKVSAYAEIVDIGEEMSKIAMILLSANLFSKELSHDQAKKLVHAVYQSQIAVMRSTILSSYWPTRRNFRFFRARAQLRRFCQMILDQRKQSKIIANDMVQLLMQNEDYQQDLSHSLDEIMTFLIAGHETTAAALTWVWYVLSQYPETLEKIKQEVTSVDLCGDFDIDVHLTFCRQVVQEVLRLYPPIWGFPRRSVQGDVIAGFVIPKNSAFILSPYVMHRLSHYWYKPDQFIPERFDSNYPEQFPKQVYMPFGGGPHLCIAGQFALRQAVLVLATIVKRFHVEVLVPQQATMPLELLVSLRPGQKILAKFHCR